MDTQLYYKKYISDQCCQLALLATISVGAVDKAASVGRVYDDLLVSRARSGTSFYIPICFSTHHIHIFIYRFICSPYAAAMTTYITATVN